MARMVRDRSGTKHLLSIASLLLLVVALPASAREGDRERTGNFDDTSGFVSETNWAQPGGYAVVAGLNLFEDFQNTDQDFDNSWGGIFRF